MVLVTGAGGKTGLAVIRALKQAGLETRALVNRERYIDKVLNAGAVDIAIGDMRELDILDNAMRDIESIYHICPNVHPDELHIGQRVIKSAKKRSVSLLVYHSVLRPQTVKMPHHWQKLLLEEAILESGLTYIILQPAPYMQNLLASWNSIANEGQYRIPYNVGTLLSLVDLNDVAEAAATVLTSNEFHFGVFELCGSGPISQIDVADIISRELDRTVKAVEIPIEEWKQQVVDGSLNEYAIEALELMFRYYNAYGLVGNVQVLSSILNRRPASLSDFVQRELSTRQM